MAMRKVKGKNTSAEIAVRGMLKIIGKTGYRLCRKDLPGKPDIAFLSKKLSIFVHGCFWHGHNCKRGARIPKINQGYWQSKIERNKKRDLINIEKLHINGWKILIVWECELSNKDLVIEKLKKFIID